MAWRKQFKGTGNGRRTAARTRSQGREHMDDRENVSLSGWLCPVLGGAQERGTLGMQRLKQETCNGKAHQNHW